jgi:serine/threonine-protein kinase
MLLIAPGQVIHDTYRIEKLLGSGGMADVYLVTHCRMPRQFALKVMHAGGSASAQFLERFQREAKILAQLRHSHIVDVIDHNTLPDGRAYLVMDLLDGEDLSSYLSRHDGLPLHVALQLCHQIGDALAAAHAVGITHRDLKPSNIFICNNGPFPNFVRILDFGIAKVSNQSADMAPSKTHTAIVGTPGYMAPEQVYGRNDKLGPAADQFALAAILYEMLSGRAAFYSAQDSVYAIMSKTVSHDPPELELGLPQLREAIKRALSKEPEDRFPSIQQFLAATGATSMTVVAEPSSPQRVPPSTLGERQGEVLRSFSRRRFIQSVALTVLCAIAAGSGVALLITHPTVILNRSPDLGPVSSIAPSPPAVSDL